jgi:tRNA nucleotidyltransferase (CCA-adding enzyme)
MIAGTRNLTDPMAAILPRHYLDTVWPKFSRMAEAAHRILREEGTES